MRVAVMTGLLLNVLAFNGLSAAESQPVQGANGAVSLQVPDQWTRKQPSVRIIEHEYSAPAKAGDAIAGRLTMMAAGGSVKDNLARWIGQFDAKGVKKVVKDSQVNGMKVHQIDLRGTYNDRRGPFAPATKRADYRMLGAIVEMKSGGLYFLKFYGPDATISANQKAFQQMVGSLKSN